MSVDYATGGGTATAGEDYTHTSGTLTFSEGEQAKTVPVPLLDDDDAEDAETLTLTLSNASNGVLEDAEATGTIRDTDTAAEPLTAEVDPVETPGEHDGSTPFEVVVEFSEDLKNSYSHVYLAASGTSGGRPVASARHEGNSDKWRIRIDSIGSAPVVFRLAGGGTCAGPRSPVLCTSDGRVLSHDLAHTIPGPARISVADATATEGTDANITFTVSLSRDAIGDVSVDYATGGGTATAGEDYTHTSGTLTFTAGERTKTVPVPLLDDDEVEDAETLVMTLSNPSRYGALDDAEATATILDTDTPAPDPLTAAFDSVPAAHTGDPFTFKLTFSEHIAGLGYRTLRDSAFTVTRGRVTDAKRRTQGSNLAWNITVEPDSSTAPVTVTLPETTDCNAARAICTADGRPLSNSNSATVAAAASASARDAATGEIAAAGDDLATLAGLTPAQARAALLGELALTEPRLEALDRLGNRNGRYDLGDLLAWTERCRRGGADCGGAPQGSGPAGAAALLLAPAAAPRRRRSRSRLRRGRTARLRLVPLLLAAAVAASCTGDLAGPAGEEAAAALPAPPAPAPPGPGFLAVEWTAPAGRRDTGALLEIEGPGADSVRAAPGLEAYRHRVSGRLRIIVLGPLRPGPLLRFRVPDRAALPRYRVRVLEVTGEDFGLRNAAGYRAAIGLGGGPNNGG